MLWDVNEGFGTTFDDVESLAAECRFNDCSHDGEPGVRSRALVDGSLERERYASYTKLQREPGPLRSSRTSGCRPTSGETPLRTGPAAPQTLVI